MRIPSRRANLALKKFMDGFRGFNPLFQRSASIGDPDHIFEWKLLSDFKYVKSFLFYFISSLTAVEWNNESGDNKNHLMLRLMNITWSEMPW